MTKPLTQSRPIIGFVTKHWRRMMRNKITVDLDFDQVSELVRTSLIQDYEISLVQWPYHEEGKSEKLLESLKEVIEYYSTREQYREWQKTLEKNGDE